MSAHMRPAPGPRPGGPGGPGGLGMTLPAEKAKDFKGTFRRLLRRLRPERVIIAVVLGLAVVSVRSARPSRAAPRWARASPTPSR